MQGQNFDNYVSDYRKVESKQLKISGADSFYFSEYKVLELKKRLNNRKISNILDLGCGDGSSAVFLNKYFPEAKIFGVDISIESIRSADGKNIPNSFFCQYDGNAIPFSSDFFDLVFISCVLHHVPVQIHYNLVKECYNVLQKKGIICVFEHNPYNIFTRLIVNGCVFDRNSVLVSALHIKKILFKSCFKNLKIRYTIFFPRFFIFKLFVFFERYLHLIPLGCQYYILADKWFYIVKAIKIWSILLYRCIIIVLYY